jgi:naphthalene 1,2-dioxygenase ferredoxin component
MTEQISEQWVEAGSIDAVPEDEVIGVEVGGKDLALYRVGGQFYATDNICTHGHARLCDGFLEGHEIECPLHQGKFDIRDGRAMCAPLTVDVRTYPIRIEDGKVFVAL